MKPLLIDLFCGLGGFSEPFIEAGWRAVGFDIEKHDYGKGTYPGEFVLRDVRSINGADIVREYGVPALIVASPPCQAFSYMAMPWSKAKAMQAKIESDPAERVRLTDLFNQCFRIQREVSAAAGHYVPMVVENVRGAQRWVGKAKWAFGSFYLWGDVPALMPIPVKRGMKGSVGTVNGSGNARPQSSWDREPIKLPGRSLNAGAEKWRPANGLGLESSDQLQSEGTKLPGNNSPRRWEDRDVKRLCDATREGSKGNWLEQDANGKRILKGQRATSSKSKKRKEASATIAKIPKPLGAWLAKCFYPKPTPCPTPTVNSTYCPDTL
jgi:hypothetical protein